MPFPPQMLYLCAGNGLYRMHLYSLRHDSWSIRDYRALARIGEGIVFKRADAIAALRLNVRNWKLLLCFRIVPAGH